MVRRVFQPRATRWSPRTLPATGADLEAGMAKLFASEAAMEIALSAMRIHGGYGYSTEFDIERCFRDAPLMIVGEGTNEIQRGRHRPPARRARRPRLKSLDRWARVEAVPVSSFRTICRISAPNGKLWNKELDPVDPWA
jgi:hypothetical protein